MRPKLLARQGMSDITFSSDAPGTWSLTRQGRDAWVHLTLVCLTENTVKRSVFTNDAELIKKTLTQPGEGLSLRSFQVIFPSDFPDNTGVGVADVYKLTEAQTRRGEIFHWLSTKFGTFRIGGPVAMMASHVKHGTEVVLYTAVQPHPRYYGN